MKAESVKTTDYTVEYDGGLEPFENKQQAINRAKQVVRIFNKKNAEVRDRNKKVVFTAY